MNTKSIRKPLLADVVVAVLLLAFGLVYRPGTPANSNNVFNLQVPSFVGVARAEAPSGTSIIEDEAGISAYFNASTSINLSSVRSVFRTIEAETTDYIIGLVPVPNYGETEDVHVYIHKDGWILTYYPAGEPVGKIFDWIMYRNTGRANIRTKLENTLVVVADAAGVPFSSSSVTYYHFQHPNATQLMLIVDWRSAWVPGAAESFQVKLPDSFTYYERSWSLGGAFFGIYDGYAEYRLDGATIHGLHGFQSWLTSQGLLTAIQLLPDNQFHTIEVIAERGEAYGGLALVYRVP